MRYLPSWRVSGHAVWLGSLAADLSAANLAARAEVGLAHFVRIFRDATVVSPHRYVLAAREGPE